MKLQDAKNIGALVVLTAALATSGCGGGSYSSSVSPSAVIHVIGSKPSSAAGVDPVTVTVRSQSQVTLTGNASDGADAAITAFSWTQSDTDSTTPKVTLLYLTSDTVTFTAPKVNTDTTLNFTLSVTTASNKSATAHVAVTLKSANDQDQFLSLIEIPHYFKIGVATKEGLGTLSTTAPAVLAADVPVCITVNRAIKYWARGDTLPGQPVAAGATPPQTVSLPPIQADTAWTAAVGGAADDFTSYTNPRVSFAIPALNQDDLFVLFNNPVPGESSSAASGRMAKQLVPADIDSARLSLTAQAAPGPCVGTPTSALSGKTLEVQVFDQVDNPVNIAAAAGTPSSASPPGTVITGEFTPDMLVSQQSANYETADTARAYYDAIDPTGTKTSLTAWLSANCFDPAAANYGADSHAIYTNNFDLGFGRDMYVKTCKNGDMAALVINYISLEAAAAKLNPIIAVAMEYAAAATGSASGKRFTKFYAFAPDDRDGNFYRVLTANFDHRGEKYLPGSCLMCHGGTLPTFASNFSHAALTDNAIPAKAYQTIPDPTTSGAALEAGNIDSTFMPWDLDSLLYSDTDLAFVGESVNRATYTRAAQEAALKALNKFAYATYQTPEMVTVPDPAHPAQTITVDRYAAAKSLVEKWYGGPGLPSGAYSDSDVPAGWAGKDDLYHNVFARNCRACHTLMSSPGLQFSDAASFTADPSLTDYVFRRGVMPLARLTMDRTWASYDPSVPTAASILATNLGLSGTQATVGVPHARIAAQQANGTPIFTDSLADSVPRTATLTRGAAVKLSGLPSTFAASYAWTLSYAPASAGLVSNSKLVGSTSSEAGFSPDKPGIYTATLTVSDGSRTDSQIATFAVQDLLPSITGPTSTATARIGAPFVGGGPILLHVTLGDGTCPQHTLVVSADVGTVTAGACSGSAPYTIQLNYTPAAVGSDAIHVVLKDIDGEAFPTSGTFDIYLTVTSTLQANHVAESAHAGNPAATTAPLCILSDGNDSLAGQTVTLSFGAVGGFGAAVGTAVAHAGTPGTCSGLPYLTYTAPSGFIGTDTFGYTITGPGNQTSSNSVSVAIAGTVDFNGQIYPILNGTCSSCHHSSAGITPFLPAAGASVTSYYQALCGASVTTGPCTSVLQPAGTLIDVGTPSNSTVYSESQNPPAGMAQYSAFAALILQWANEGAYCSTTGAACP